MANLKKAKTMYVSRQQEYEKAKDVAQKAETESLSSSAVTKAEKKKKQVDDTLHRVSCGQFLSSRDGSSYINVSYVIRPHICS